jgi:hypothetical protein
MLRTCTVPDAPPASAGAPAAPPDGDPLARALQGAECEVDLEADPPAQ